MSQCVPSSLKHPQTKYGKHTCQPLSVANFSGTTTHCGHELGKPRLCSSASTLSHLSGLGKTTMGLPTATSGNQAFLTSMVATASAGGTWVSCYIAERAPNGNRTLHNCLQFDRVLIRRLKNSKVAILRKHAPRLITHGPHFWVIILFESLPHENTKTSKKDP